MEIITFAQKLDKIVDQAIKSKSNRQEPQQDQKPRGTGSARGRGSGRSGRSGTGRGGGSAQQPHESASAMGTNTWQGVEDDDLVKYFNQEKELPPDFDTPPRWFMVTPAMRRLGVRFDKIELKRQDRANAKKYNCESQWRANDKAYWDSIQGDDKDQGADTVNVSAQLAAIKKYARKIKKMKAEMDKTKKKSTPPPSPPSTTDNQSDSASVASDNDSSTSSGDDSSSDEYFSDSDIEGDESD